MANIDGLSATRAIVARAPTVRILLLTASDDVELGMVGLRAGAAGHQVKGAAGARSVVEAVRRMAAGEPVVGPDLTWRLIESLRRCRSAARACGPSAASSPRASGRCSTCSAPAARSTRSPTSSSSRATPSARTSSALLRKLGAHSQAEAISIANGIRGDLCRLERRGADEA